MGNKAPKIEQDSVAVKASATSASVEITGNAAARATHALVDIISPFTNAAGWLGDSLSHARTRAAIRAASKAKELLNKEGIAVSKIPPKILLPWLDGASMETDENESLVDAWAGLFVRAAKSSDAVTISYIDTLKKLGKDEAELLEFFATDTSPFYSQGFYDPDEVGVFSDANGLRKNALKKIAGLIKKKDEAGLHEFMGGWGFGSACQIIFYSAPGIRMRQTQYFRDHEHVIANLQHLGLVDVKSKVMQTSAGAIEIIWFQITKYAFDLVWACQGTITGHTAYKPDQFVSVTDVVRKMKESDDAA